MKKLLPLFLFFFISLIAAAQGDNMQGGLMRSHLKMYVVVAVLLIIFTGIIAFLIILERRLKKLEDGESNGL